MHDPKVVAFEVCVPIPHFRWKAWAGQPRWGVRVSRHTNAANRGERVYRWLKPKGYSVTVAGRQVKWRTIATIWHNEPGDRDALTVCRHRVPVAEARSWYRFAPWWSAISHTEPMQDENGAWEDRVIRPWGFFSTGWHWHVHHWSVQIHGLQAWRRWRHSRCAHCGRRFTWGYAPVSHSWGGDGPSRKGERGVYHHECSSILSLTQKIGCQERAIRYLFDGVRVATDLSEQEMLARFYTVQSGDFTEQFWLRKEIEGALGWEFDHGDGWPTDDYPLVHKERAERFDPFELAKSKGWR